MYSLCINSYYREYKLSRGTHGLSKVQHCSRHCSHLCVRMFIIDVMYSEMKLIGSCVEWLQLYALSSCYRWSIITNAVPRKLALLSACGADCTAAAHLWCRRVVICAGRMQSLSLSLPVLLSYMGVLSFKCICLFFAEFSTSCPVWSILFFSFFNFICDCFHAWDCSHADWLSSLKRTRFFSGVQL